VTTPVLPLGIVLIIVDPLVVGLVLEFTLAVALTELPTVIVPGAVGVPLTSLDKALSPIALTALTR
jgi:hypothetical protein